jgi:hypothetical protein
VAICPRRCSKFPLANNPVNQFSAGNSGLKHTIRLVCSKFSFTACFNSGGNCCQTSYFTLLMSMLGAAPGAGGNIVVLLLLCQRDFDAKEIFLWSRFGRSGKVMLDNF